MAPSERVSRARRQLRMDPATLLVHADEDASETALAPPIHQTVPFAATSAEDFKIRNTRALEKRSYRRYGNPNEEGLESVVASLENAEAALTTAAGMGAISTTLLALLRTGDHVVAQQSMYGGTLSLLRTLAPRVGIDVTFVDQTNPTAFHKAITDRTKVFLLETPSNPLLQLTDVREASTIARQRGIVTVVDNTIATPVNQQPLDLGADLVVHSVTKGISGHSDVLAGMVLGKKPLVEEIWETHILLGSVVSPFDAWLALRGARTLAMRARWQEDVALAAAAFLEQHDAIQTVNYPGLSNHPQHRLAMEQMTGFGGVLSFELAGGYEAGERLIQELRLPAHSSSLGGFRSLVVQPAALWGGSLSLEELDQAGVPVGLVRLAVGLEHATDLIADLDQALTKIC